MNFSEAWAELLAGHSIRRQSWDKGFYWLLVDGNVTEFGDEPTTFIELDHDDLMATDWEIYR